MRHYKRKGFWGGGDIYQQWISVEKEKALGFIQQDLTFGVHQQQLFFFLPTVKPGGEGWRSQVLYEV